MDCAEIRQAFIDGGVPSGRLVTQHVKHCPHCAQLFGGAGTLGRRLALATIAGPAPHARWPESLLSRERGLRAFLRSRSSSLRWALSLTLPALLLLRELARGRVPFRELSTHWLAGFILLVALVVIAYSALHPVPPERRAARLHWALALLGWGLPCVLWLVPEPDAVTADFSVSFAARALACFGYGSALAAPCFGLLWALDRGTRFSYRVAALAAAAVAVLANLILLVHCPITDRMHLIAGHFGIGVVWFLAVSLAAVWTEHAR